MCELKDKMPSEFQPLLDRIRRKRVNAGFRDVPLATEALFAQAIYDMGMNIAGSQGVCTWKIREIFRHPAKRRELFRKMLAETWGETWKLRHDYADAIAFEELCRGDRAPTRIRLLDVGSSFDLITKVPVTTVNTVEYFAGKKLPIDAFAVDMRFPPKKHMTEKDGVRYLRMDACEDAILECGKFNYIRCLDMLVYYQKEVVEKVVERLNKMMDDDAVMIYNPDMDLPCCIAIKSGGVLQPPKRFDRDNSAAYSALGID